MSSLLRVAQDRLRWAAITAQASVGVPQRRLGVTGFDCLIESCVVYTPHKPLNNFAYALGLFVAEVTEKGARHFPNTAVVFHIGLVMVVFRRSRSSSVAHVPAAVVRRRLI